MNEHPVEQADEEALTCELPDDRLEAAAGMEAGASSFVCTGGPLCTLGIVC